MGIPKGANQPQKPQARTTSGEMLLGLAVLGKSIESHVGSCPMESLIKIALELSAAGYTIAKEHP